MAVIGLVNFLVSFGLALLVGLDARDVLVVRQEETGPTVIWDRTEENFQRWLESYGAEFLVITAVGIAAGWLWTESAFLRWPRGWLWHFPHAR